MLSTDGQGNDRPPTAPLESQGQFTRICTSKKVSYQGKNKNNCVCKPAECLLAALLTLAGEESHSPGITKVHRVAQDLFLNFSRVKPKEFKTGL